MKNIQDIINVGLSEEHTLETFGGITVVVKKIKVKDQSDLEKISKSKNPADVIYHIVHNFFEYEGEPLFGEDQKSLIGELTIDQITEIQEVFSKVNKTDDKDLDDIKKK